MRPLTFAEGIEALEGTCDRPVSAGNFSRVCIDSRELQPGDLFIAIPGERFDGHDFVEQALAGGAMAVVVRDDFKMPSLRAGRNRVTDPKPEGLLIRVDDTVKALGRLGRYYRRSVVGGSLTVIAVTGSNGKTTTKAMIAHVLSGRWQGRASVKSFNNVIGVPLTLLSVEPSDVFVVCEVGTNAPGEIAALAKLIEPEIAVITGVSEAHLEGLGSLGQIAEEKLSLLHHLRPEGLAVVNADCEVLRKTLERDRRLAELKCVTFGEWKDADIRVTGLQVSTARKSDGRVSETLPPVHLEFTVNDRFKYELQVPGRHNVLNALAAIGVARRLGVDHEEIAARLATFSLPPMRLEYQRVGDLTLVNDAYNANPASLAAAVDVLVNLPTDGRKVLIVGDMRELGEASEELHRQAAEKIAHSDVNMVIAIGEKARLVTRTIQAASGGAVETHAYSSADSAKRRLVSYLDRTDAILMKGSRLLALEKLVPVIKEWAVSPAKKAPARAAGKKKPRSSDAS
ncbi:MAG: UDP-N-acetylmuramoyl-tripeptide--D-alanyl-D-alanine ligase [Planctomycetes bacterium]|nr:UDP-N-acetylmuramoyl-tripeptide--D-alanyl-D-alanine ligase [Planctomycetota bacterium]